MYCSREYQASTRLIQQQYEKSTSNRTVSMLKMVTLNHIRQKPIGNYALPLIQKIGKSINLTTHYDDVNKVVDCSTPGISSSMGLTLLRISISS